MPFEQHVVQGRVKLGGLGRRLLGGLGSLHANSQSCGRYTKR